ALPAAMAGPVPSADDMKSSAGRSFDLSAVRPADAAASGFASSGPAPLASATRVPMKALPAIPALPANRLARARAYAPKILLAAAAGAAVWVLNHFGIHPALAAGPLALLAGTLGANDNGPSPSLLAQFMSQAAAVAPPGKILTGDEVARIGQRLALEPGQIQLVLTTLMQAGDLGLQDNRIIVHYGFAARARAAAGPKTSETMGDAAAREAVQLLNSGAPLDHAKGLNTAAAAIVLYEKAAAETGKAPEQLAEAKVLRANLALEHIGDLLRAHKAGVEAARPADDSFRIRRVADVDAALEWLKTASYQVGSVPPIRREVHSKILQILLSLSPRDEQGRQGDNLVSAYIEAVDLMESYASRDFAAADGTTGAAAPAPASDADGFGLFLVKEVMPGERVDDEAVQAGMKKLGWDATRARNALTELARRGYVVIRDNGIILMTSLPYRAGDDELKSADAEALAAVKLLNSTDPLDHLRAVARLDRANAEYVRVFRARGRSESIHEEIQILMGNAALEAAGDALRGLERSLRETLSGERAMPFGVTRDQLGERLTRAQNALQWLKGAAYSADRRFELPPGMAQSIRDLLDLRAFREIVKDKIKGEMDIVHGTRLVRAFLERNAEGGRAYPALIATVAPTAGGFRPLDKSEYKTLLDFGTDVTQKAVDGKLRPMIGRKAELRQMVKTLLRVEKNNPLVIGEKGVGKTAIVNGLAQMIAAGEIPQLRGRNVIKIDLNKVVAGTSSRGMFEARMQGIIDEARKSEGRVILFIDEIHMIVGAGDSEGATDASQILKESLSDGSISLIGATTTNEFRRIEKDGALMRRFNPVKLAPPTKAEAEEIVEGVKKIYEDKHKVSIGAETVKAAVSLAYRYVTDRHLPDSALDLMDDASAEVELKASEAKGVENPTKAVTAEDIAQEISMRTGIPAGKLNEDKKTQLKNLPSEMKAQVIGQDEAVEKVAEAVQAGETGYRDPKQPIASFVFLGPTGVGKTELARVLAKIKFGSEKNMLRLDMSEYQEKQSVSRLISAPPGYVGHEEGGQLTESVRRNPYQVILLDEIEKAHPEVFDVLLQVLEDGRLTDGQGRTVDFSNTIIIMTSNIGGSANGDINDGPTREPIGFRTGQETEKTDDGYDYKMDGMGFGAKVIKTPKDGAPLNERQAKYLDAFKKKYRPEFVNRVGEDRVIVFNEITEKSKLGAILDLRLKALELQLKEKALTVTLTDAAREAVLAKALTQSKYGARPIKQIVDREINRALKDADLEGRISDGDAVTVDWDAAAGRYRADKAAIR
ncbi:MAG: AAA family ATPase, partial [Elusimicrobiota bacterium]